MSEIKVGDLVWIARPVLCCGTPSARQGEMFVVGGFDGPVPEICRLCGHREFVTIAHDGRSIGVNVNRLKKVPPIQEPESSTTEALDPADCLAAYESRKEMT